MSAHPGVALPRRRIRVAGPVIALCGLFVVAACDQPESPEAIAGPQFSATPMAIVSCPAFTTSAPTKTAEFTVKLSTNVTRAGVVVTLIHPEQGPSCYGSTNSAGKVSFSGLSNGEAYFVSIRDEISAEAPQVEIGPADPNEIALTLLEHGRPSLPATRQMPTLLSGNSCTKTPLAWSDYSAARPTPCVVPTTGGPSFSVNAKLDATPKIQLNVVDPNGAVSGPVLIAAISTPAPGVADPCGKMPWLNQTDCNDPEKFSGPGLLQAMNVTHTGQIGLGVRIGSNPLYIEATAPRDGFTLFGTLVIDPQQIQIAGVPTYTVYLAPGMCKITTVPDHGEPSGFSQLDIDRSSHSIGMMTTATGLGPMQLLAVPTTVVVKTVIYATATGGIGELDLQYRGHTGPGNRTVRVPFSIVDHVCAVGEATGTGVSDIGVAGYCTDTGPAPDGRREFTLYFTLTDVLDLAGAEYRIKADKDHLDPSRSDAQTLDINIARGRIQITPDELQTTTCPVTDNNDGRWLIV